jgi:lysine 2,3-aminomutase
MVVQLPTRVTPELCAVLERNRVQMINIHINHPKEITPLLRGRVKLLQKAGVMMGLQTVCLKGVNDSVEVMRELFMQSIEMGVRPYYVYSTDMVEGAHHFIVPHRRMLELYEGLRGWISGPAVPTFIVDGLGGLGKLPIIPSYVREETLPDGTGTTVRCRNDRRNAWIGPGLQPAQQQQLRRGDEHRFALRYAPGLGAAGRIAPASLEDRQHHVDLRQRNSH